MFLGGFIPKNIEFLTKEQTAEFLLTDRDKYFKSLTRADLCARGVDSSEEYATLSSECSSFFNASPKLALTTAARLVDEAMKESSRFSSTIDLKTIAEIPWRFARTVSSKYENAWPHTRASIVFLPEVLPTSSLDLAKLLAHEKIHIFQRAWPEACGVHYVSQGFERISSRCEFARRNGVELRANPDLDCYVYSRFQKPCYTKYSSSAPKNMDDVIEMGCTEHPHEALAYAISGFLFGG